MPKVLLSGCIVSLPMGFDEDFRHLHLFFGKLHVSDNVSNL